jgi:acarbose 7IV-phosphotransferase
MSMAMPVDCFPLTYSSFRQTSWMNCQVVGGALNVAGALLSLGDTPQVCTLVGEDAAGWTIRAELRLRGLEGRGVVTARESAKSMLLIEPDGRAARNSCAAGAPPEFPLERYIEQAAGADLAVITSRPFGRQFLGVSKELLGLPVAVDLHTTADLDDERQRPWFETADVLFRSHEGLTVPPEEWIASVLRRYPGCAIAAVGHGDRGCVMGLRDGRLVEVDAIAPRPVRNTDGAGDALFAAFLHGWLASGEPVEALASAVLFAGWKIGAASASDGFVTHAELTALRGVFPVRYRIRQWR